MDAAYAVVALPLLGSVVLLFAGRRFGDPGAGWLATVMSFGAFAASIVVWATLIGRSASHRLAYKPIFDWMVVGRLHVDFALQLDPLSVLMILFVTGVGSLIHLYSIGYMRGDRDYPRFFFLLNLFLFSMLVLVLADNFLFSFLGWEGVGFCSYALVGFWFERPSAAVAAKKAFVTNRMGDFGFMIALFLLYDHFHSFNYASILLPLSKGVPISGALATGIGLMLFLGAVGKSAQIPLYMWLPDAMEGPTPVSALIHAATMVTAGVYLVARAAPILHYSHAVLWVIGGIGAATLFLSATIACAQDDIKRVLAYSTISQLGYMFLGEAAGDYAAGLYHMVMHAFFKALLFLAAGSVIHALHDEQDMKKMGGLRKYLPVTTPTFIVGALALSGIFPFDGFWSKGQILEAAWHMNGALWGVGVVTEALTAYYMGRQVMLTFYGRPRFEGAGGAESLSSGALGGGGTGQPASGAAGHAGSGRGRLPHESPLVMLVPLVVLAVLSVIGWLVNAPFAHWDFINRWLAPVFPSTIAPPFHLPVATKVWLGAAAGGLSIIGFATAVALWRREAFQPRLEPAVLRRGWFIDEGVAAAVSGPLEAAAAGLSFVVDGRLLEAATAGLGRLTAGFGRQLRRVQTGYVRNYALGIGIGGAILLAYLAARVGS